MKKKTKILTTCFLVSIFIGTFVVATFLSFSIAPPTNQSQSTPSQVVNQYLSASYKGDFEEVERLIISKSMCSDDLQEISSNSMIKHGNYNPDNVKSIESVNGSPSKIITPSDIYFGWIKTEFPNMVFKSNLQLRRITRVNIIENKAEVDIELKNNVLNAMSWTIILLKEQNDWKVSCETISN